MSEIKVAGIIEDSITDGPGLRTVIFMQGCPRRCKGCHNPSAQSFEGGTSYKVSDLFDIICSNPLCMAVTFSGGEPFSQPKPLAELAELIKNKNLELAIYTGFTYEQLIEQKNTDINKLLSFTNILIDGEYIQEKRNLNIRFKGSENQRIIDIPASLKTGKVVLITDEKWL